MARQGNKMSNGLEAGDLTSDPEKSLLQRRDSSPRPSRRSPHGPVEHMSSPRRLIFTLLVCFLVTFGVTSAISPKLWRMRTCRKTHGELQEPELESAETPDFVSLLGTASPASLHDILHKYFPDRFKDGVYSSDRSALEAVHHDDATLATSLVRMAKRDGTNSTSTPPLTSTTTTTTTAPPTTSTPESSSTPTSSPPPVSTNSNIPPSSSTSTATVTSVVTTSNSAGTSSNTVPTSPSSSSPTTSARNVSSSRGASTLATKSSSSSSSERAVVSTFTSTNANGGVTVVTATSYVAAGSPSTAAAATTGPAGSLQNGAPGGSSPVALLDVLACGFVGILLLI